MGELASVELVRGMIWGGVTVLVTFTEAFTGAFAVAFVEEFAGADRKSVVAFEEAFAGAEDRVTLVVLVAKFRLPYNDTTESLI